MEINMDINNTLIQSLGIEVVSLDKNQVEMTMPVDERTRQPAGFLHGGASVALAESDASVGAYLNVDPEQSNVFGLEINANHMKSKREGIATAKAIPRHIGKTTMVWEIDITVEQNNFTCVSRCTIGVVPKKGIR